jgi:hypothetical protein
LRLGCGLSGSIRQVGVPRFRRGHAQAQPVPPAST